MNEGHVSMGAIYGVIGDARPRELEAMGARLAHRGAFGAQWSPAPGVWFGMQSRELSATRDGWPAAPRRRARQPLAARAAPRRRGSDRASPVRRFDSAARAPRSRGPRRRSSSLAGTFALAWWRSRDRTLAARPRPYRLRPAALHDRPRRAVRVRERVQSAARARHRRGTAEPRRHPGATEHEVDEARRDLLGRHLSRGPRRGPRDRCAAHFRCSATGTFRSQ